MRSLILISLLVLTGCATQPQRINQYMDDYQGYPETVQDKLDQGIVDLGFDALQAYIALGSPDDKQIYFPEEKDKEVWKYYGYRDTVVNEATGELVEVFRTRNDFIWGKGKGRDHYEQLVVTFSDEKIVTLGVLQYEDSEMTLARNEQRAAKKAEQLGSAVKKENVKKTGIAVAEIDIVIAGNEEPAAIEEAEESEAVTPSIEIRGFADSRMRRIPPGLNRIRFMPQDGSHGNYPNRAMIPTSRRGHIHRRVSLLKRNSKVSS